MQVVVSLIRDTDNHPAVLSHTNTLLSCFWLPSPLSPPKKNKTLQNLKQEGRAKNEFQPGKDTVLMRRRNSSFKKKGPKSAPLPLFSYNRAELAPELVKTPKRCACV